MSDEGGVSVRIFSGNLALYSFYQPLFQAAVDFFVTNLWARKKDADDFKRKLRVLSDYGVSVAEHWEACVQRAFGASRAVRLDELFSEVAKVYAYETVLPKPTTVEIRHKGVNDFVGYLFQCVARNSFVEDGRAFGRPGDFDLVVMHAFMKAMNDRVDFVATVDDESVIGESVRDMFEPGVAEHDRELRLPGGERERKREPSVLGGSGRDREPSMQSLEREREPSMLSGRGYDRAPSMLSGSGRDREPSLQSQERDRAPSVLSGSGRDDREPSLPSGRPPSVRSMDATERHFATQESDKASVGPSPSESGRTASTQGSRNVRQVNLKDLLNKHH